MLNVDPLLVAKIPEALRHLGAQKPKKVVTTGALAAELVKMKVAVKNIPQQLQIIAKNSSMKGYVEFLGGSTDPMKSFIWGLPGPEAQHEDWKAA